MTSAAWTVLAGVGVAVVWAVTRYVIKAISTLVVIQIGDSLQRRWKADIEEALETIRDEVTTNGGLSLKDKVMSVERQLEVLLTR